MIEQHRGFRFLPETVNEDQRSIEAVIATENPVAIYDWGRDAYVDEVLVISGVQLPAGRQMPFVDTHDTSSVKNQLGSTREMRIENGRLVGRNYFVESDLAEHAWRLAKGGHATDNSIRYQYTADDYETIDPGQRRRIGSRMFTAAKERAKRVVTRWAVKENSLCPIGADKDAKNRQRNKSRGEKMTFEEWLRNLGFDNPEGLSDGQRHSLQAMYDAEVSGEVSAPDQGTQDAPVRSASETELEHARQEGQRAEQLRANQMRDFAPKDMEPATVEKCIRESHTLEEGYKMLLQEHRAARPAMKHSPNVIIRNSEVTQQQVADALLMRGNCGEMILAETDGDVRAEKADKLRSMSLVDACRYALVIAGRDVPMDTMEMIQRAFSTLSLPTLLSNVANKAMLKGYSLNTASWSRWCSTGNASDYKDMTRLRATTVGGLTEVGENGKIDSGEIVEAYETFSIARYARLLKVDDMVIRNDDLGAIVQKATTYGRKAQALVAKLVYLHLLSNPAMGDSNNLFDATNHLNLNTTNPLTYDNLCTAVEKFMEQVDSDGEPIDIIPRKLIVPPGLAKTAKELVKSALVMGYGGGNAATTYKMGTTNVLQDELEVIPEPRLANTNYSGYNADDWYLTADPNEADTVEVAFLDGRSTPVVERKEGNPDEFAMIWRVRMDCGVKALDWAGMQKNDAA